MNDELLRVEEGRQRIRAGRTKFYDLVKQGKIVTCKVGGSTFVKLSELNRFIDSLPTSASMQVMQSAR